MHSSEALSKVIGLFDARARLVFIDRSLHIVKQTFIRLHETAHGFMPWQSKAYALMEDCEKSLSPDIADEFDREANAFASEVLFQLDTFDREAEERKFEIWTPIKLSGKYGASIYASIRRYVRGNVRACAVLVLEPPQITQGSGFRATFRRFVASPRFAEIFGAIDWPNHFTPDDQIGGMVPLGRRKASRKREIVVRDQNGDEHLCIAEAFTQTHQVFVLVPFPEDTHGDDRIVARESARPCR